jgi:ABC-type nitrate/sulfonate/bicarbonate transport system substrate-binding protein
MRSNLMNYLYFMRLFFFCDVALIALAISSPVLAQDNTARVGYNKIWATFPLHVAIARKNFEQRGVDVKWVNFTTPNQIQQAMVAGELDLGVLTGPNLAVGYERGVRMKGIALLTGTGDPPNTLFARKDLDVKSVRDLKGKTIGVNNYAGAFDIYLRRQLADNGLDPNRDVRIVEIPIFQIIPAITNRIIDAGFVDTIFTAAALKNYTHELTPVFSFRDVEPFKDGWNGLILAANDSFVAKNRATVVLLLRGYLDAVAFGNQHPHETVETYVKATGNKTALLLERGNDVPDDARILMRQMQADLDLTAQYGYIKTHINADAVVDHGPLQEAAIIK